MFEDFENRHPYCWLILGLITPFRRRWPLYDLEDRYVMVLDEFDIHSEKESERRIVD